MIRFFLFLCVVIIIWSCNSSKEIVTSNNTIISRYTPTQINPQFVVYHDQDSSSIVYFKLTSEELLYAKKESSSLYKSKVSINYKLIESYEKPNLVDKGVLFVVDTISPENPHEIVGSFRVNAEAGNAYVLTIIAEDSYKKSVSLSDIIIDKKSTLSSQNFIVRESSGKVKFDSFYRNEPLYITFNATARKNLTVRYYSRDFSLAAPPFSVISVKPFDFKSDSIYTIEKSKNNFEFSPNKKGLYLIQADTIQRKGLCIINSSNPQFPTHNSAQEIIEPLRFITTKKEF